MCECVAYQAFNVSSVARSLKKTPTHCYIRPPELPDCANENSRHFAGLYHKPLETRRARGSWAVLNHGQNGTKVDPHHSRLARRRTPPRLYDSADAVPVGGNVPPLTGPATSIQPARPRPALSEVEWAKENVARQATQNSQRFRWCGSRQVACRSGRTQK